MRPELLASGMSGLEMLADCPELEAEDLRACLRFGANRGRASFVAWEKLLLDENVPNRLLAELAHAAFRR